MFKATYNIFTFTFASAILVKAKGKGQYLGMSINNTKHNMCVNIAKSMLAEEENGYFSANRIDRF